MARPLTRLNRYRHVVFTGSRGSTARMVNLAPAREAVDASGAEVNRSDENEPPLSEDDDQFLRSLFACAGLDAAAYRPGSLRRRLHACLRALRATSILEARRVLATQPALVPVAINAVVLGVSSFFRDSLVFDQIASEVLPALFRAQRPPVRIWSVGCSEGQELYSVAMLLAERNLLSGCHLLGTDCRADAIHRAREGCYDMKDIGPVVPAWAEKYFDRQGDDWQVIPSLRAAVQWRTGDVTRVQEPGAWDLILCRNMAMYLRAAASGKLWDTLERALRPGGYLVVGKAERPASGRRLSPVGPCLFRRDRG